jgi:hypothetical protein
MKSFFINILRRLELNAHDGRPLWQYVLSTVEYNDLKQLRIVNF